MAAVAKGWPGCLVALSWQRVLLVLVGIIFGLSVLLVGFKLRSAGISGFAETDYLWIETKEDFSTADLRPRNLRLKGLTSLKLPSGRVLTGKGLALFIDEDDIGDIRTTITRFKIVAGSQVYLKVNRAEGRLTLEVKAKELYFQVIPRPGAQVQIDGDACPEESCDLIFQGSGSFDAMARGGNLLEMGMDLGDAPMTFTDRVAVSAVKLWESERLSNTVERRGAVKNGSFRFLEAPDQTVTLERGAVVDLEPDGLILGGLVEPAGLILRGLEVRGESVYLQLSGRVGKVALEIGDTPHSLMPTVFDWLSRNRYVQIIVGIITLLLGGGLPLIQGLVQRSPSPSLPLEETPSPGSPCKSYEPERSPSEASPSEETPPEPAPIP